MVHEVDARGLGGEALKQRLLGRRLLGSAGGEAKRQQQGQHPKDATEANQRAVTPPHVILNEVTSEEPALDLIEGSPIYRSAPVPTRCFKHARESPRRVAPPG